MPEINYDGNVKLPPIEEIFKESKDSWGSLEPYPSYEHMFETAGIKILYWKTIGDYQGDYYVLVTDGHRYGYVSLGYGSCSGCDALQACDDDLEQLDNLRKSVIESIHWELTKTQLLNWLSNRDWEVDAVFLSSDTREVVEAFNEMQKILHPNYVAEGGPD